MPKARTICAIFAVVLHLAPAPVFAGSGTPEDPFIFGIVPARSPDQLLKRFGPMVSALEDSLGLSIRLRGARNNDTFVRRVADGNIYDFVLSGGDTFQYARERSGYVPVAKMKSKGVFAVFAVQKDSTFQTIEDLAGQARIATSDPLAYSTELGLRALREVGIDPDSDTQIVTVPSQSASLMALVRGQVDAAVIMVPVFRSAEPAIRDGLRIVAETARAPPPIISASDRVPERVIVHASEFFRALDESPEGREILKNIGWPGFEAVRIEEYDQLEWAAQSIQHRLESTD